MSIKKETNKTNEFQDPIYTSIDNFRTSVSPVNEILLPRLFIKCRNTHTAPPVGENTLSTKQNTESLAKGSPQMFSPQLSTFLMECHL